MALEVMEARISSDVHLDSGHDRRAATALAEIKNRLAGRRRAPVDVGCQLAIIGPLTGLRRASGNRSVVHGGFSEHRVLLLSPILWGFSLRRPLGHSAKATQPEAL